MIVLKYNSYGMPSYWIITDPNDLWFLKVVKRIDKNSSEITTNYPKSIAPKVAYIRQLLLNEMQKINESLK